MRLVSIISQDIANKLGRKQISQEIPSSSLKAIHTEQCFKRLLWQVQGLEVLHVALGYLPQSQGILTCLQVFLDASEWWQVTHVLRRLWPSQEILGCPGESACMCLEQQITFVELHFRVGVVRPGVTLFFLVATVVSVPRANSCCMLPN